MSFTSLEFFVFLPVVFALYWLVPHKYRWAVILVSSYYFYMSWSAKYAILIFATTFISWLCGILVEKYPAKKTRRFLLAATCVVCFGILFVFKYFNWFFACLDTLFSVVGLPSHPITLKLLLPVGISFYTFQTMSYVIDVCRGDVKAERHFGVYAAFITFFPQLVAGPIERSGNLLPQIKAEHTFSFDKAIYGAKLILWGYFKKMVVADFAAIYVDKIYGNLPAYTGMGCVMAMVLFTMQIYCDFSGYSDIAIGVAKMFDFDLMTNFKSPYFAPSIRDFWSRWHISLSTWFRDYVYIPLGGNRCSKARRAFNMMTTMLVSGLWHGASFTFVVWGGIHGAAQLVEDGLKKPLSRIRRTKIGRVLLTLLCFGFCNIAWVFFRAETFGDAFYVLSHCLDGISAPMRYLSGAWADMGGMNLLLFLLFSGIVAMYDLFNYHGDIIEKIGQKNKILSWVMYTALGLLVLFFSQKGVPAEFVYFQF